MANAHDVVSVEVHDVTSAEVDTGHSRGEPRSRSSVTSPTGAPRHWYLALAVVLVMLAAGCKSSGDQSSTTSSATDPSGTTAAEVIVDPRAPGVTDDTIKVGVPWVDLSSIKDLVHIDNGDFQAAYQAMFDDINAKGGIHGRKLEPVFAPINPVGNEAADAACTKLTQDDPVFVAVGFFLDDNVLCYVNTNETAVIGGTMTAERLAKAKAPWYSTEQSEDLETDVVRTLAENGKLDGSLAVLATASEQKLLEDQVQPVLDELGIKPVTSAVLDAPTNDAAATSAAAQTIAEKFKAAGADEVLIVGQAGPQSFLGGLAKTDYRPQLIFTNSSGAATYTQGDGADLTIMKDAIEGGGFGPSDARWALGGPTKECFDIQRAAGLEIPKPSTVPNGQPNQFAASYQACSQMTLLAGILEKAGPELNYGTFETAGNSLHDILLPSYADPFNFGPPPHADGDQKVYVFTWDPSSSQFVVSS